MGEIPLVFHRGEPYAGRMAVETPAVDQRALIGRQEEVELLDRLLGEARAGRSNTLVLRGEPGIGKTALLEYAMSQASDGRVLQCRGVEWESELPFSGLIELVRPLVGSIDELPEPQRAALAGVLALEPAVPMERFAAYVATLSLLALASRPAPLLVVVDDAHWLDASSAEALAFVARRLQSEGILVLVAVRDDETSPLAGGLFPTYLVTGLGRNSAEEFLLRNHPDLKALAARAVLDASAGNPLALRELPAWLADATGAPSEVEPLPTGPVIENAFLRRVRRLPLETQRALLVASAGASNAPRTIFSAMQILMIADDSLDLAEQEGLIRLGEGRLVFDHPLVRSAIYSGSSRQARRKAHAALAEALTAQGALDQSAWHRAAATTTAEESVAADLEKAAARARARNGHGSAARAFERAAHLTPNPVTRSRRLHAAAVSSATIGRSDHALALLSETVDLTTDPILRADAQHLRGRLLVSQGAEGSGDLLLREGLLVADRDWVRATVMVAESIGAYLWAFDLERALEVAREAERIARPGNNLADLYVEIAVGFAEAHGGEINAASRLALSAVARLEEDADLWAEGRACVYVGMLLCTVERYERARSLLTRIVAQARATSALSTLAYALTALGVVETRSGRWFAASTELEEAVELTRLAGSKSDEAWALVTLARLEAARGDDAACRSHVDEALARSRGLMSHMFQGKSALGLLELGAGRPEHAIDHIRAGVEMLEERGSGDAHCQPYLTPDLVEAFVRCGMRSEAEGVLEPYERAVMRTGVVSARAAALRSRGLVASPKEIDDVFGRALTAHEQAPSLNPFERARTRFCYGERLRRAKRRGEAERQLEAALGDFERLGANPWAERVRSELALTSPRKHRPRRERFDASLTPQELRVALAVATGATNREVAAQLFLSVKTIENHLSRVFEKLEIRSRSELARIVALNETSAAGGLESVGQSP